MTTFTPPVADGVSWAQEGDASARLMKFYGSVPTGVTVWQDQVDQWHEQQYPYHGRSDALGLAQAKRVYVGGHVHDISSADAAALTAAGYGSRINIAPVQGTWKTEELAKYDTKVKVTDPDGLNLTGPPYISGNDMFTIRLATGINPGQSGLREWFLNSDTSGWTDSRGVCVIDPPVFSVDYLGDPAADILPQMGVVLREQFNSSTGKNQGITLNNNTIFGLSMLNIGAWHAFPDGTGFNNRQFQWPLFESIGLPYGFEWELIGNIIKVRIFNANESPETTPWSHPTHARILNLDVDCGSPAIVPTPTGPGTNGIISAHLGINPLSAVRIRPGFRMERI